MKSPIFSIFKKVFKELQVENSMPPIARRKFIKRASMASFGTLLAANLESCKTKKDIKIAIIGGGIAGLTAAHYLNKQGFKPIIYEAAKRTGGRIMSVTGLLAEGITTELGGEFIDSSHQDMLNLCQEFHLDFWDMHAPEELNKNLVIDDFYFANRRISEKTLVENLKPFFKTIQKDAALVATGNFKNPNLMALDKLSLEEYLQKIGITGWLYDLLRISYACEMGLDADVQSCLAMLGLLDTNANNGFDIYGESDERYKIIGGNQRVIDELAKGLVGQIETGYQLESYKEKGFEYSLNFSNGKEIMTEYVIMTIPFSVLRAVKTNVDMSPLKMKCIQELSYGTNSKMFLGMKNRIWRDQGFSGYVLSNLVHNGWDSSQMQQHNVGAGGYSTFMGGKMGKNLSENQIEGYLDKLNLIYPNMKEQFNDKKGVFNWTNLPFSKGSYACMTIGQMTAFGGEEAKPVGNILFAGEHCSKTSQGYMNGGAETGRMAAEELIRRVMS